MAGAKTLTTAERTIMRYLESGPKSTREIHLCFPGGDLRHTRQRCRFLWRDKKLLDKIPVVGMSVPTGSEDRASRFLYAIGTGQRTPIDATKLAELEHRRQLRIARGEQHGEDHESVDYKASIGPHGGQIVWLTDEKPCGRGGQCSSAHKPRFAAAILGE